MIETWPQFSGIPGIHRVTNHAVFAVDRLPDFQAVLFPRNGTQYDRRGRFLETSRAASRADLLPRTIVLLAEVRGEIIQNFGELRLGTVGAIAFHLRDHLRPAAARVAQVCGGFGIVTRGA